MIRAFHEAFSNEEMVRLVIAGDGSERSNLEKLAESLGEKRIAFLGRYKREDIDMIFSAADAFVLTSEVEPFGIVYIEALAHGLPCIGTRGQGADDIIDKSSGYLVDYGEIDQLSMAMKMIKENRLFLTKKYDLKKCTKRFLPENVCREIEQIYIDTLKKQ